MSLPQHQVIHRQVSLLTGHLPWALCLLFCTSLVSLRAQPVNGIWTGSLTQEAGGCFPAYHLELQISVNGQRLTGDSYDYYDQEKYVRHHFSGNIDSSGKIVVTEQLLIASKIPPDCIACTKTYILHWSKEGDKEQLTGSWTGHKTGNAGVCPPGQITLHRAAATAFPQDAGATANTLLKQADSNFLSLEKRENQLFGSLLIQSATIRIDLYDNAEIDNDTVTVFLNNQLLLFKQRLTGKPLTVTVHIEKDTDYELVMYANNLGLIPPNTALMVLTAGKRKYEIRLSASDKKNAAVRFRSE
ncbi:MAG: hypothetical protein QM664_06310 [Flavihumibacter sp.]